MILNILLSLLVLNIMVIAHELGHFILARKNKIGVHEFAIGFGPTLWKKKWKGTMWMIKAFPLGGYNGLKGEMEEESGEGNFNSAPKRAKLQVLVAGSFMNVVMAIIAFYVALGLYGWKVPVPIEFNPLGAEITTPVGLQYPQIVGVAENSPASKVTLDLPYQIKSINGNTVTSAEAVVNEITNAKNDKLTVIVLTSDNEEQTVTFYRDENKKIGVSIAAPPIQLDYSTRLSHKLFSGFSHAWNMTALTGKVLGSMISFTAKTGDFEPISYALAGPVAIVAAVGSVVDDSKTIIADLANMTGLIGISLAVFNLLPFPGLDGWHIFLLFYEKARGRKPNEKLVGILTAIGLIFLLSLGVIIMLKDVWFFFIKR